VHHWWHGTHRYEIQVLATYASTWVHGYSSQLQWSVALGQRSLVGRSFAYFARNARCTVTTDLDVWYSNTQNDFYPGAAIFSLHTLASPSGRYVNYDEKQLTGKKNLSCSFYLYLLTPWRRVLLEQLTGLQLVKKFPAFHGTRRSITALTSVRHLSILGQPNPVHIPTSHLLEIHPNIIHPSTPFICQV